MTNQEQEFLNKVVGEVKQARANGIDDKEHLINVGALSEDGEIIAEYPKLFYVSKGEVKSHDEGGQMLGLNVKHEQMEKEGINCWIEYLPRYYSFYVLAKQDNLF